MKDESIDLAARFGALADQPEARAQAWEEAARATLKGRDPAKLRRVGDDGVTRAPIYFEADASSPSSGYPELAPFTRGARVLDRRVAGWDIRQLHATGTAESVAAHVRADMERGASSLLLSLRPALDPDATDGIVIHDLAAFDAMLDGVDLASTPVAIEAGPYGASYLIALVALARRRGVPADALTGAIHTDPHATLARHGALYHSHRKWWDAVAQGIVWSREAAPWVQLVEASGLPYQEAGASAAHELGAILASGAAALRQLDLRGIAPEEAARRAFVQVGVGADLFTEIAKLRALRRLWARLLGACGVSEDAREVFVHAQASRVTLTSRDPWANLLRGTVQGSAAAIGGADAITVLPFDTLNGDPTQLGRRQAVTTQHVLEHEAHLARVADPAGGSWYVESLTEALAQRAWAFFQEIEGQGGLMNALTSGWLAAQLAPTREARARRVATRKDTLIGVNDYIAPEEDCMWHPVPETDRGLMLGNDGEPVVGVIQSNDAAVRFEAGVDALERGRPLADVNLSLMWGMMPESLILPEDGRLDLWRVAAPWEALRACAEDVVGCPSVFLANIGPLPRHKARAGFATRLARAAGLVVVDPGGFDDAAACAAAFTDSDARAAIICGHDDDYTEQAAAFAAALTGAGASAVLIAGRPGEDADALAESGVTGHIYLGCDALGTMSTLLGTVEAALAQLHGGQA